MKIGVNPLSWSNDDLPTLGGETSLETCLQQGKAVGFQGFELGNKFPREPKALASVLQSHGLELASGWFTGGVMTNSVAEEIERLKPHCELLAHCGAEVLIYCDTTGSLQSEADTPLSARVRLPEEQWPGFSERLSEVGRWCSEQGLPLAYHFHMGTVIQSETDIDHLMQLCSDDVGLLLDTGHASFAGMDVVAIATRYASRIRHVHLKDIRRHVMRSLVNRDVSFIDAILAGVFTVPGDGDLPIDEVIKVLVVAGYDQWLIVEAEQDPAVAPSVPMVTTAYNYITSALRRA